MLTYIRIVYIVIIYSSTGTKVPIKQGKKYHNNW